MHTPKLDSFKSYFYKSNKNYIVKEEIDFHIKDDCPLFREFFTYSVIKDNSNIYFRKLFCSLFVLQNHKKLFIKNKTKELINKMNNSDKNTFIFLFYFHLNSETCKIYLFANPKPTY